MSTAETVQVGLQWEYMELGRKTEGYLVNELNDLGQQGWELVSVSFQKDIKSGMGGGSSWIAFLKRPRTGHVQRMATLEKAADVAQPTDEGSAGGEAPDVFDFKSE